MQTYVVRRAGLAHTAAELDAALMRLRECEQTSSAREARWLRSYAVREEGGGFGLACVFQARDAGALRRHAELAALPAQEVLPVLAGMPARALAPTMVYLVRRRAICRTADELRHGVALARRIADEQMPERVSWLRSYAVSEDDGSLGLVCLYQAVGAQALREHAGRTGWPADEIQPVLGRIVFRDDEGMDQETISARAGRDSARFLGFPQGSTDGIRVRDPSDERSLDPAARPDGSVPAAGSHE